MCVCGYCCCECVCVCVGGDGVVDDGVLSDLCLVSLPKKGERELRTPLFFLSVQTE